MWRLFEKVVALILVLALIAAAFQFALSILQQFARGAARAAPSIVASMFWTAVVGLFCIGLLVRVRQWLFRRNARAARAVEERLRRGRLSARPPAEDVPAHGPLPAPAEDPDPALRVGNEELGDE